MFQIEQQQKQKQFTHNKADEIWDRNGKKDGNHIKHNRKYYQCNQQNHCNLWKPLQSIHSILKQWTINQIKKEKDY